MLNNGFSDHRNLLLVINKSKNEKPPRLGVAESTTLVLRDSFLLSIGLTDLTVIRDT